MGTAWNLKTERPHCELAHLSPGEPAVLAGAPREFTPPSLCYMLRFSWYKLFPAGQGNPLVGLVFILPLSCLVSLNLTIPFSQCLLPCATTSVLSPPPTNGELGQTRGNKLQGLLEPGKAASRVTRWGIVDMRNWSHPSAAKLNRWASDCVVPTAKDIYYLALLKKSFLTSGLRKRCAILD